MATFFEDMNYALQQGGNLSNTVLAHQHKLLDEQAQIKARTQMLEYKVAENQFLQELESNGDYASWSKRADDFLMAQKKYINSNAGNALTAKYMNQNLDSSRANLQMQVSNRMFDRMRKDELNEYNRQMQLVEQNTVGQERIDGIDMITNEMLKKGHIDEAGRDRILSQTYSGATLDEYTSRCNDIASKAVSLGWTEDQTEKAMQQALSELPAFMMKGSNGEDISQLFTPEMKSRTIQSAIKGGNDVYKNDLEQLQAESKEYCAELLRLERSLDPSDIKGRNYYRRLGQQYLRDSEKQNPNSFSAAMKQEYSSAFQLLKEPEGHEGGGGSRWSLDGKDEKLLQQTLVNMMDIGKYTGDYEGVKVPMDAFIIYENHVRAEARAAGLDEDAMALNARYELFDLAQKQLKNHPELQKYFTFVKNELSNAAETTYEKEIMLEKFEPRMWSIILDSDFNSNAGRAEMDQKLGNEVIGAKVEEIKRKARSEKISRKTLSDPQYFKEDGSQSYAQQWLFVNDITKTLNSPETYVYRDPRRGAVVVKPECGEIMEKYDPIMTTMLSELTGSDKTRIFANWEKDGKHRLTDQRIFVVNGKELKPKMGEHSIYFVDDKGNTVITEKQTVSYFHSKENGGIEGQKQREEAAKTAAAEARKKTDELDRKRIRTNDKVRDIQEFNIKHGDEVDRLMKSKGMGYNEALKMLIDEHNQNAVDKIEWIDNWDKIYDPNML